MSSKRMAIIAGIVVVVFALVAGGIVLISDHGHHGTSAPTTTSTTSTPSTTSTTASTTTTTTAAPTTSSSTSTTAPATTTTSSSTTSTIIPAASTTSAPPAGGSATFPQLVSQIQSSLRTGKLPGAGRVPDAMLGCPHPVSVAAGNAFACNVDSKDIGNALLVVEITSAAGSYTPFIGDTIGCAGLTAAGRSALRSIGAACNSS